MVGNDGPRSTALLRGAHQPGWGNLCTIDLLEYAGISLSPGSAVSTYLGVESTVCDTNEGYGQISVEGERYVAERKQTGRASSLRIGRSSPSRPRRPAPTAIRKDSVDL